MEIHLRKSAGDDSTERYIDVYPWYSLHCDRDKC